MILLDTNVILRHLIAPTDEKSRQMAEASSTLFPAIRSGQIEATVSEVVVHEVCYVLGSKKHYALTGSQIRASVAPLFDLRGLTLTQTERRIFLRALEIYANDNKLGSADALVIARCEVQGLQLATHDPRMKRSTSVSTWNPE